jgi:fatty acid desaturase
VGLLPLPADQASYTPAQQLNQTRSVRSRLGALILHFDLHKEHHLFPSLHYRYLPVVQRLLRQRRPDLYAYTRETAAPGTRRAHELLSPTEGDRCPGPTSI